MTHAQRRVFSVLTATPQTPAEIKRRLPGRVPVATIRRLLVELERDNDAARAIHDKHPGITAWVQV